MRWRSRALWLPALAVLLPCLFLGAIAAEWLSLEREAAARRTEEAAHEAVAELTTALSQALAAVAPEAERLLRREPPAQLMSAAIPPPASGAFLFDERGQLVLPMGLRVDPPPAPNVTPPMSVITNAARALAAGRTTEALDLARTVFAQYPGARDEFGVALVSYAAWQRASLAQRPGYGTEVRSLAADLHGLIESGHFGLPADVTQASLLLERAAHAPELTAVLAATRRAAAKAERDRLTARAAETWLAGSPHARGQSLLFPLPDGSGGAQVAVAVPSAGEGIVVLTVDPPAIAAWMDRWTSARTGFAVTLARDGRPPVPATFTVELFPGTAAGLVAQVRPVAPDAPTDRERERLFVAAVGGAVALTLIVGYLALRDVSRELSVASARASFIAGVTHELKTPLTSIRLLAETLLHDRARPEQRPELLGTIVHETEQLSEIMDNVLSSARIESGTRIYQAGPVVIANAVRDVLARFEYVLAKEGMTVEARVDDSPTVIQADAAAFAQALLNLLSNAVKYSGSSRRVVVSTMVTPMDVQIAVEDFGVGLSPVDQRRVFDRFYRGPATSAHTAGAGLGLALVKHFAEAHGGRVLVRSQPGQGSVFTLALPLAPAAAGSRVEAPARG